MTNLDVSDSSAPQPEVAEVVEVAEVAEVATEEEAPKPAADVQEDEEAPETSPKRSGPPSETSSQDWDRLTDTGSQSFTA